MKDKKIVDQIALLVRDLFKDIDDYVVFASFALYLHGREKEPALLADVPDDLDIAVHSREGFDRVKERISTVPEVRFDNDGEYYAVDGNGALVLSGQIPVRLSPEAETSYFPFEVFYHSRIVQEHTMQHQEVVAGVRVLNLKGLQEQYFENYVFESRVQMLANEIAALLSRDDIEARLRDEGDDALLSMLEEKLHVGKETVSAFYELRDALPKDPAEDAYAAYDSQIAALLVGQKTEVKKRLQHVKDLQRLKGVKDV